MAHLITIAIIATTWVCAFRTGCRLVRSCGIHSQCDVWALASILPTAGLIASVHALAVCSLLTHQGLIIPEIAAILFVAAAWGLGRLKGMEYGKSRDGLHLQNSDHTADSDQVTARRSTNRPLRETLTDHLIRWSWWWWPIVIVIGMYGVLLLDALTRYPTGYDALHYHLPNAVTWVQSQSMDLIVGFSVRSYPENGMIVPMLLMFAGLERLLTVVHFPKAVLLAVTVYALSSRLGISRRGSIAATCIALSIPIVAFQSVSAYIDLYAAASWLAALLAIMWASRVDSTRAKNFLITLAGLSAGISLGSKTTYLVLVGLLVVLVIFLEWFQSNSRPNHRLNPELKSAAIFGTALLFCSSFWFLRGLVQAQNPLYPLGVNIADTTLLPGFTPSEFNPSRGLLEKLERWWNYPWREWKVNDVGYPYGVNNGLGAAFATFVPIGLLFGLLRLRRCSRFTPEVKWIGIFTTFSILGIVLLLTVFRETLRFILPLALIGIPVAAILIDQIAHRRERLTVGLLSTCLWVTAMIAGLMPLKSLLGRLRDGGWNRSAFYEIPAAIDHLPEGSRVLNLVGNMATYPLHGAGLTNKVISPLEWEGLTGDGRLTRARLREHNIDYVCITNDPHDEELDNQQNSQIQNENSYEWLSDLKQSAGLIPIADNRSTRLAPTTEYRVLLKVTENMVPSLQQVTRR